MPEAPRHTLDIPTLDSVESLRKTFEGVRALESSDERNAQTEKELERGVVYDQHGSSAPVLQQRYDKLFSEDRFGRGEGVMCVADGDSTINEPEVAAHYSTKLYVEAFGENFRNELNQQTEKQEFVEQRAIDFLQQASILAGENPTSFSGMVLWKDADGKTNATIVHTGNTRIYLAEKDKAVRQITTDHNEKDIFLRHASQARLEGREEDAQLYEKRAKLTEPSDLTFQHLGGNGEQSLAYTRGKGDNVFTLHDIPKETSFLLANKALAPNLTTDTANRKERDIIASAMQEGENITDTTEKLRMKAQHGREQGAKKGFKGPEDTLMVLFQTHGDTAHAEDNLEEIITDPPQKIEMRKMNQAKRNTRRRIRKLEKSKKFLMVEIENNNGSDNDSDDNKPKERAALKEEQKLTLLLESIEILKEKILPQQELLEKSRALSEEAIVRTVNEDIDEIFPAKNLKLPEDLELIVGLTLEKKHFIDTLLEDNQELLVIFTIIKNELFERTATPPNERTEEQNEKIGTLLALRDLTLFLLIEERKHTQLGEQGRLTEKPVTQDTTKQSAKRNRKYRSKT